MSKLVSQSKKFYLKTFVNICFLAFAVFFLLAVYSRGFGDAFENIVGGWLINQGLVLYRDQFVPRAPLMYYLAALSAGLFGLNLVRFRLMLLGVYLLLAWLASRVLSWRLKIALALFLIFFSLAGPLFKSYMFLADSLVGLCLALLLAVFINRLMRCRLELEQGGREKDSFSKPEKRLIGLLVFTSVNASITSLIAVAVFSFFYLIKELRVRSLVKTGQDLFSYFSSLMLFPAYFLFQGALRDFLWTMFPFGHYYFLYRLGEPDELKCGRFGFVYRIIVNFWEYSSSMAVRFFELIGDFCLASRFFNPLAFQKTADFGSWAGFLKEYLGYIGVIMAELVKGLGSLEMAIFLVYWLAIFFLFWRKQKLGAGLLAVYSLGLRARTNEFFHLAPYFLTGFFLAGWLLVEAWAGLAENLGLTGGRRLEENWRQLKKKLAHWPGFKDFFKQLSFSLAILFLNLSLAVSLAGGYLEFLPGRENWFKPAIVWPGLESRADFIKKRTKPGERIWLIDQNPVYYLLARRLPANKYYFYFPYFFEVDKIREEALAGLKEEPAKVIFIFDWQAFLKDPDYQLARQMIDKLREGDYLLEEAGYLRLKN